MTFSYGRLESGDRCVIPKKQSGLVAAGVVRMQNALAGRTVERAYGCPHRLSSGIEIAAGYTIVRTLDRRLGRALDRAIP